MNSRTLASILVALWVASPWTALVANDPPQSQKPLRRDFDPARKAEAPIILCIDDKPTSGGQPTEGAYAKAAANGFRSILTLRSARDGVDLLRERLMVEKHRLRYFNLAVTATLPAHKQIDEFLALVRDKGNHPMLVNCAYIERVAPYLMIFNLVEQGWSEERAVEDASRSGLRREELQALARGYLKSLANKSKAKARS
jgi:protein tyrosine phosphatase (PTP) superfamily phosphohydrolase (DUF442 family)